MRTTDNNKLLLYFLAAVNFVHIMDFMIMMPLGDMLMRIFEISPARFSAVVSSYTFAAGVSGFLGAFWIDRFDRRAALLVTFTGFTIGTFTCAFAFDFYSLLITRAVTGVFGGVMSALIISIASDIFPFKERGYAMGVLTAAFSFASVVGVPFGLYMSNMFDWHAPFLFMAGFCVLIGIVLYRIMPSMPPSPASRTVQPLAVLSHIFRDRNQVNALLLGFLVVMGHFMIIPFIAPYLIRNVGFSSEAIPLVYMIGGGFTIFTAPYIGRLTDRLGPVRVFTALLLMSFVPVLLLTNLPPVALWVGLLVTSLFFIFGSGRMIPAQTLITGAVSAETRGSFMSIRSSVQQLGTATASLMSGLMVAESTSGGRLTGYHWAGWASVLISLATLLMIRKIKVVDK